MRITYEVLKVLLDEMSDDQLNCDVTVEIPGDFGGTECIAAELRIAGDAHESLDPGHPVLFVNMHSDHEEMRFAFRGDQTIDEATDMIYDLCEYVGIGEEEKEEL